MSRRFALPLLILTISRVVAQDSSAVAPKWVLDMYLGSGSSELVAVRTGPDAHAAIDLSGWFQLGMGMDRRIERGWSVRGSFSYEIGGAESSGPGNPFAAPALFGDRVALGAGMVRQLHRDMRNQFVVYGGARVLLGMDIPVVLELDTSGVRSDLRMVQLFYRTSVNPVISAGWRRRVKKDAPGCIGLTIGATYFQCSYDHALLPNGMVELPADLMPLTGSHAGWNYLLTIGFSGIP